jgi:hypothetical protein
MILGKEEILKQQDLDYRDEEVPEWCGTVRIRMMTGTERDSFENSIYKGGKQDMQNIRSKLLVNCLIDGEGKRLFKQADIEQLGGKSAAVLDRLFKIAQELNGMGAGEVELLAKNLGNEETDTLSSSSREN